MVINVNTICNSKISTFAGPLGFRGVTSTPDFEYGIKMDLDPEAKFVAGFHKLTVDKDDLIKVVADSFWKIRCA